jgi:hypothetical protein
MNYAEVIQQLSIKKNINDNSTYEQLNTTNHSISN